MRPGDTALLWVVEGAGFIGHLEPVTIVRVNRRTVTVQPVGTRGRWAQTRVDKRRLQEVEGA